MKQKVALALALALSITTLIGCSNNENKPVSAKNSSVSNVEPVSNEESESSEAQNEKTPIYTGEEGKITVYLSGPAKMISDLEASFEKDRGDVLDMYHAGCGPLRQKIWTEVESGNVHADVFFGSNPIIYNAFKEKGVLEKYVSPQAESIKPELQKVGDGYFTLVNIRYEVLVYDKLNLSKEEAPKSYEELKDPKWKDKLAYTDLSQSSTALALSSALWEINGQNMSFFEGLKANNPLIVPKSKAVADKIQSGEIQAGITAYDAVIRLNRKAKKEGFESSLGMVWPEEGAIQIERPIAIMKNEARPEKNDKLSKEFVDFMLSPEGQKITVKYGFYSVRNDISTPKGALKDTKAIKIDWKSVVKNEKLIREDFKNIMIGN